MIQFDDHIFSDGLKPPTSSACVVFWFVSFFAGSSEFCLFQEL